MANPVITFFEKIGGVFKKLFGSSATWEQTALATIKYVAPLVETLVSLTAGPAVGTVVANVINEVKADLATLYTIAQQGAVVAGTSTATTAINALTSINDNMAALLADSGVKNSAKVADIEATANLVTGETNALLTNLAAPQAA